MKKISLMSKVSQNLSSANSLRGTDLAETTDQWSTIGGITVKTLPLFSKSTSWLKYEEIIDAWLDLKQLEDGKRGPALKNRLVGDAAMYKGLLDQTLRSED